MTTIIRATASPPATPEPLTFDERLALAALAVDARINSTPFDLAEVIRLPAATPLPLTPTSAPCPYNTPLAALLHRARVRIESDGWCRDALVDEQGARCPIGAIRIEATGRDQADDACVLLLDVIQQDFADATIPSWNAAQTSPAPALRYLDRAAQHAHSRDL